MTRDDLITATRARLRHLREFPSWTIERGEICPSAEEQALKYALGFLERAPTLSMARHYIREMMFDLAARRDPQALTGAETLLGLLEKIAVIEAS